jgi:DHA1 family multidrug resistance protein-like MFS transporter
MPDLLTETETENKISDFKESESNKAMHSQFPTQLLILMMVISGLFTTANFITNAFTGLYAVIIGATGLAISLMTSLRNFIQLAVQSTFGRFSDKIGRRLLIFIGLLGSGIFVALFPLIKSGWLLIGGMVMYSLGVASYMPAFTALQGDISIKKNRAGLIGLLTIIGALASMIGLISSGFAGNLGQTDELQYTIILEIAAGIFIIAAIISLFIREPEVERIKIEKRFTLDPIKKNKTFRRFVIINSIMHFSMSLGWPIFPFVREEFATAQQNTWIWAAFALFQIISMLIVRPFINKISRKKLLILGRILMFYVPLNLAITVLYLPYWWHLGICNMTSGLGVALYMVGQNSYILDCAPENKRGTYTGIYNFFIGVSSFIGSLLMGSIYDVLSKHYDQWLIIVILCFVIAGARFVSGLNYFFLEKPAVTIEKEEMPLPSPPTVATEGTK